MITPKQESALKPVVAKHFIIVGAGVGGLATALRLSHLGHKVTVLEKTGEVGGRNKPVQVGDCHFDGGPTLMMMLGPFEKLFKDVGEKLSDHLDISLCDPSYRVFWSDGKRMNATTNMALMLRQIEELCGSQEAAAYPRLLADLSALFHSSIPNFVEKNFYTPLDFLTPKQLGLVAKHRMIGNLAKRIDSYFQDPRLRMLFSFQTMYLGLSPFESPWVYATLTYMEYGEGIWYPKGGVVEIARAIARLAASKGAEIRLNSPVCAVTETTVTLKSGEVIQADGVVLNADLPYSRRELQKQPVKRKLANSCSTFMMYMDYEGDLPELLHHNVFFGQDFKGNLDQIFNDHVLPDDPAFYACINARTEADNAPKGHENLYILVPCSNLTRPWSQTDADAIQNKVFERLKKEVGFDPAKVKKIKTYTPEDWKNDLNLEQGAAFGISHHFLQSAFFRPANVHDGVFYVGASTVPGNGLPMVLISADLAVQRIIHEGVG